MRGGHGPGGWEITMTAQGKINASSVQTGDRILIADSTDWQTGEPIMTPSRTKTGETVRVVRVTGKSFRAAQGRYERQGKYVVETTAGTFEAAPSQTMWLAPEDPAGVKRAHVEALAEDEERYYAGLKAELDFRAEHGIARDVLADAVQAERDAWAETQAVDALLTEADRVIAASTDALTELEPVDWAGRKLGELTPDEQRRVARQAGRQLQAEFDAAGPALAEAILADEPATVTQLRPTVHGRIPGLDVALCLSVFPEVWTLQYDTVTCSDCLAALSRVERMTPEVVTASVDVLTEVAFTLEAEHQAYMVGECAICRRPRYDCPQRRRWDAPSAHPASPLAAEQGSPVGQDGPNALRTSERVAVGDVVTVNSGSMRWTVLELDGGRAKVDLVRGSILGPQWMALEDLRSVPAPVVDIRTRRTVHSGHDTSTEGDRQPQR